MIFKTFIPTTKDATFSNSFGMFNKSFSDVRADYKNGNGLGVSVLGNTFGGGFSKTDAQNILNFNKALKDGVNPSKAWAKNMTTCTISAQNLTRQALHSKTDLASLANGMQTFSLKTKLASVGTQIFTTALNMIGSMAIMAAISWLINGFSDLTHAAENASKAADELYDKSNEKVEQNKEELESLDELIGKYETLRNSNDTDVDTRKEIQEVQYKIADLVGEQAKNLDLVNGKLDDQLDKLKKIKANESKKAYDDAVTNYRNSVDASEKAIASGGKTELFGGLISENYAYKGETGGREDEAYDFLIKNGYGKFSNVATNQILWNRSYVIQDGYDKNGKELKNAKEKIAYLQEMEDILSNAGFRSTKMWTGIHTQIQNYEKYTKQETEAINSMLDAWSNYNTTINKKLTSINVNSVDKLKKYRSTMIDLMEDDEDIKQALKNGNLTETDILTYVDNYIATDKQFAKWYNQYKSENKVSTGKNNSKSSILKDTVDNTKKELDDVKKDLKEIKKKREKLLKDFEPSLNFSFERYSNDALKAERQKLKDWGLSEYQKQLEDYYIRDDNYDKKTPINAQFGNIDMDNRKLIVWNNALKKQYKEQLKSWNYNPEVGGIDTVFGGSMRIGKDINGKGMEIAFSPVLQTDDGAVLLSKENVGNYLSAIYKEAAKDGKVTEKELLELDKDPSKIGFKVGKNYISGLIAGADSGTDYGNKGNNNKAVKISKLMHFFGRYGAYNLSDNFELDNIIDSDKQITKLSKRRQRLQKEYEKYEKLYHYQQKVEKQIKNAKVLSSSWKGLDDTDDEELKSLKKDLTELGEAGKLTKKNFLKVDGAQSWLDSLGLSADYVVKKVNELIDSSKQLASLKSGISKVQDALLEKKTDGVVGADTLGGMESEFGNLKSWKNYKETLGSSTTDINACRDAQKKLVTEYINSNNFLSQLVDTTGKVDEKTKQYYTSQLKEMGVKNAEQVVNQQIKKQKLDMLIADAENNDGISNNIDNLIAEGKQLGYTEDALKSYILKKVLASKDALKTSDSIKNLVALAKQCGVTSKAIDSLSNILLYEDQLKETVLNEKPVTPDESLAHQSRVQALNDDISRQKQKLNDLLSMGAADIGDIDIGDLGNAGGVDIKDGKPKDSNSKSKNGSSNSSSKQEFDWIDRRVTVLTNKIEKLNAAKENIFSVKNKNKNLNKQIKESTKLLATYSTAYKKYKNKANSVKLDSSLKAKVRNGSIKGSYSQLIKEYGEKTANKIQKYIDYWDKAQNANKSWQETEKNIRELKVEKLQNYADKYSTLGEIQSSLASRTNTSYTTQNSHLAKQQKYLQKNYEYQIKIAQLNGKTSEAKKLQLELEQQLLDIEKQKVENIKNKFQHKIDEHTYNSDYVGNQVDIIESKGQIANNNYYKKQIAYSKSQNTQIANERKALQARLNSIERGTDAYYECLEALREINLQEQENTKQQIEWNNKMAENEENIFQKGQDAANRRKTVNETLLSFVEHEDSTDAKTGKWTEAGKGRLWAYGANLGIAQAKKDDSASRVKYLENLKANKQYGDGFKYTSLAKIEEAIENAKQADQDNAKDMYEQRKNLADLVKDHYDQVSTYLSDLVSKQEEILDQQKDLYDYQKSLQEKTDNINTIRKQIRALKGDSSEEAMAKLQQLQSSLNDSEKELNDTEYEKYISDQKEMLSKLQEDLKDFLEEYFKDFDALWKEGLTLTKGENGSYLLHKAKDEGNYTPPKTDTSAGGKVDNNKTSDQTEKPKAHGDIKDSKNTIGTGNQNPKPKPVTSKLTKKQVEAWLSKKNATKKSGYERLSLPGRNQKYSAVNKAISKKYTKTIEMERKTGQKPIKKKVGLVLSNSDIKKLCDYVGVKPSKTYGKKSPLYKKLHSLGVKGFSQGGVVDVDDLNKQVKANGDTTLISAKKGERILTPEQNKAFQKLVDANFKTDSIVPVLNVPDMGNLIKNIPNNIDYGGITFNFEVNGVNNADDLVKQVQTKLKYQKALENLIVGKLNGAGRLSVNRIK